MIGGRRGRGGAVRSGGLLLTVLVITMLSMGPAGAGPGVKLNLGAISVDSQLFTGTTHLLPRLYVTNPGDAAAGYRMAAVAIDGVERAIPSDWIKFTPEAFRLAPGQSQAVDAVLAIPESAGLGHYEGLLAAQIVNDPVGGPAAGVSLGAGAAARLGFEVAAPTFAQTLLAHLRDIWNAGGAWAWIGLAALGVLMIVLRLKRKFRFHIERR